MQRFDGPSGERITFSNGSVATLYHAWSVIASVRRPPRTEGEIAVVAFLLQNSRRFPHRYATAFRLFPPDDEIAGPDRLAYLADLVRLSAADLAGHAGPDEDL